MKEVLCMTPVKYQLYEALVHGVVVRGGGSHPHAGALQDIQIEIYTTST